MEFDGRPEAAKVLINDESFKSKACMKVLPGKYTIKSDTADIYRSIYSARRDLSIALEMILICAENSESHGDKDDISEGALWTAAIVRYARARNGYGKRSEQRAAWNDLSGQNQELDAEIRMFRDKMYAHAVGLGEDHQVHATVGYDLSGEFCIFGVAIDTTRVVSHGSDKANAFAGLLNHLIDRMWKLELFWHQELLKELRSQPNNLLLQSSQFISEVNIDNNSSLYQREIRRYKKQD